ncbi:MAG: NADH-quinone oxidoreductase subunit NuoE, partial [Sedimentisphaerales bacterium]
MDELDLTFIDQAVEKIGTGEEKVLEILQAVQNHLGYLPQEALERVCELTKITPASIAGVSTFYNQFRRRPAGRHTIHVCVGTACHVKGAERIYESFRRYLDIPEGEDTDSQKLFTIEKIACLGCCTLAPAVQIGQVTYGHLTPDRVAMVITDFLNYEESKASQRRKMRRLRGKATKPCGEIRI